MTLRDWANTNGVAPQRFSSLGLMTLPYRSDPALWALDDYQVSAVSGGAIWLTPTRFTYRWWEGPTGPLEIQGTKEAIRAVAARLELPIRPFRAETLGPDGAPIDL